MATLSLLKLTDENVKRIDLDKATNGFQTYPGRFLYEKISKDFRCSVGFRKCTKNEVFH